MRFSRSFKASKHCLPSPDGELVATLTSSGITVRLVRSLEVARVIRLPHELASAAAGPVIAFKWASSSRHLLVAVVAQIHVFSALDPAEDVSGRGSFHAVISNPAQPADRPAFLGFGANTSSGPSSSSPRLSSPAEVIMTSSLGLKLSIFSLVSSKTVEISNPKLYGASTAGNGFSLRPGSGHLAVLSRTLGKDVISVHHPTTRDCVCSFNPETVDAHGLVWSPDGRWLVVWEAPGHGHKVHFYTPDGHLFKAWCGSSDSKHSIVQEPASAATLCGVDAAFRPDSALGAGVRLTRFSSNASHLAIADFSPSVTILDMSTVSETMRLRHPTTVNPKDREGLQIWLEQLSNGRSVAASAESVHHTFIRATQTTSPTGRPSGDKPELKAGCSSLAFDYSSTLIATVLDNHPGTVWVWDVQASELRAVIMFHSAVASLVWHPSLPETLLISCEGEAYAGVAFIWDPLSNGPQTVDVCSSQSENPQPTHHSSASPAKSRQCQALWLNVDGSETPAVFLSDGVRWRLGSLTESEVDPVPWMDDGAEDSEGKEGDPGRVATEPHTREESPLELVPAPGVDVHGGQLDVDDDSELEDTFHFKT